MNRLISKQGPNNILNARINLNKTWKKKIIKYNFIFLREEKTAKPN